MNIYVDFDDVLCETARGLRGLCKLVFGRDVPYEDIRDFDLRKSFSLSEKEYEAIMAFAHNDLAIQCYKPMPDAAETLRSWQASGHATSIVTGRPPSTRNASLAWLRDNGFPELPLVFVDKYNRNKKGDGSLTMEAFNALPFDLAIEDAPTAIALLQQRADCRVIVFARPWNTACAPHLERCANWRELAAIVLSSPPP